MSLNIYSKIEDIPSNLKYIKCNDAFFNANGCIPDNSFTRDVLASIDKGSYYNTSSYFGRFGDNELQPRINLSTGAKTLLNIDQNDDYCFDVCECGPNALAELFKLQHGNILWDAIIVILDHDTNCDIIYNGKHYIKAFSLLTETMRRS
jgi:hypothetical protein